MPRNRSVSQISLIDIANDDVCTLVSIVPFLISEFKPGIYPGRFVIQPCLDAARPEVLVVGTSVHFLAQYNGEDELPAHVVKTPCKDIAKSVINDYMNGQMDVNTDCRPGVCYVQDKITPPQFILKYSELHKEMKIKQNRWFGKLVERADNDWNRYKNHKVISDNQRFAARALGLEKDWLTPDHTNIPVKCPSCMTNCMPEAIVCANCRCILKPEEYKKLTFAA